MAPERGDAGAASWLLCHAGGRLCALPLESVVETMRPLPIEPVAGAPRFVCGLSIVRGVPVPVVDVGQLFGVPEESPARLVLLRTGRGRVALLARTVLGVRSFEQEAAESLPPLLQDAVGDAVSAIGSLDTELLVYLRAGRIVPEALLQRLASGDPAP